MLPLDDPHTRSLTEAIRSGDLQRVGELLEMRPELATERYGDEHESRTALHFATDFPGHAPNVDETIRHLVAAGALVNGRFEGPHRETALHWAASSNDLLALDALIEAGADIEADGAVHTGGTPLSDAVIFAQWDAAKRLVACGARMTVWQAAALGETGELTRLMDLTSLSATDLSNACWHACRGGQLDATKLLTGAGADLDWHGYDGLSPRAAGVASGNAELGIWLAR